MLAKLKEEAMGLSSTDKKPVDISLKEAYFKIQKWYQANIDMARSRNDDYGNRSAALIEALPQADLLTDLEIRAILGEVIYGNLEWAYHEDDGEYKMAAYAHGALESAGISWSISGEERDQLKNSALWPHLMISRN